MPLFFYYFTLGFLHLIFLLKFKILINSILTQLIVIAQGSGDDTAMNGFQFKCAGVGGGTFTGPFGIWENWIRTCAGGFTGAMVKLEGKQVCCVYL